LKVILLLKLFQVQYFVFVARRAVPLHLQSFLSSLASHWSNVIAAFNLPDLHLAPQLELIAFKVRRHLWHQKTKFPELSCGIVRVSPTLVEHRTVTGGRTDRQRQHVPR